MGTAEPAPGPRLNLIDGNGTSTALPRPPEPGDVARAADERVYGFTNMVVKLCARSGRGTCGGLRLPGETFRDQLYRRLQGHAAPMPDELRPQMGYVRKVVEALACRWSRCRESRPTT